MNRDDVMQDLVKAAMAGHRLYAFKGPALKTKMPRPIGTLICSVSPCLCGRE